jgi:hypothetical protein
MFFRSYSIYVAHIVHREQNWVKHLAHEVNKSKDAVKILSWVEGMPWRSKIMLLSMLTMMPFPATRRSRASTSSSVSSSDCIQPQTVGTGLQQLNPLGEKGLQEKFPVRPSTMKMST